MNVLRLEKNGQIEWIKRSITFKMRLVECCIDTEDICELG
jgi:hypothetical protein